MIELGLSIGTRVFLKVDDGTFQMYKVALGDGCEECGLRPFCSSGSNALSFACGEYERPDFNNIIFKKVCKRKKTTKN